MDCNACKEKNKQDQTPISRYAYESALASMETANKRWFWAWLVTFVLLVGCVAGFIWYESQWETVETWQEVEQDIETGKGDAIIAGIGDIHYGQVEADSQNEDEEPDS